MKTIKQIVEDQKLHTMMFPDQVGECEECMVIAQTEILKEAMRRYRMQGHPIYAGQGNFKTVDDIVLELIKEIES